VGQIDRDQLGAVLGLVSAGEGDVGGRRLFGGVGRGEDQREEREKRPPS
jgi:hypothetical protein